MPQDPRITRLGQADSALAQAVFEMNSTLDQFDEDEAQDIASYIPTNAPQKLERLAGRLQAVLGEMTR
jgi:hypothetical protein